MPASIRTVVDLPFVPVTSAVGMAPTASQSKASGSGSASGANVLAPRAQADRHRVVVPHEGHAAPLGVGDERRQRSVGLLVRRRA